MVILQTKIYCMRIDGPGYARDRVVYSYADDYTTTSVRAMRSAIKSKILTICCNALTYAAGRELPGNDKMVDF